MNQKIASEKDFIEKLSVVSFGEIKHIGVFEGTNKNTTFRHKCGHEWSTKPSHIIHDGTGCPKCRMSSAQKNRRISHEEFLNKVNETYEKSICVLSTYNGTNEKIDLHCNTCGHDWSTRASHILNEHSGCPKCARKNRRIKNDDFVKKLKKTFNGNILALDDYVVAKNKIRFKCKTCDYEWMSTPDSIIRLKIGCPHCSNNIRLTNDEFKKRVLDMFNGEIEVLGNYQNRRKKVKLKHNTCGYIWESSLDSLLNTSIGCPKCAGRLKLTHGEFLKRVKEVHGDEIEVLSQYVSAHRRVKVRHTCGREWMVTPHNLTFAKRGCSACSESKGEKLIQKILENYHVKYERQYKFPDCKYKRNLRFDFAVLNDERVTFLIEYDGGQHFFSVEGWGGDETFKKIKKRDSVKETYCVDNNIQLLRIPYSMKDEEIENIINEWIDKYNH